MSFIRRDKTIEVTELDYRTYLLVLGNGLAAEVLLLFSHMLRLDLHTETSAHGHIDSVFEGCPAVEDPVRNRTDVSGHRICRIEI